SVQEAEAHPDVEATHLLELEDGRRFEQYSVGRSADAWPLRVWSFRDVTASRRAEEALRNSEARYRLLFEQNAAGVCVSTMDGRILDSNATFRDLVGLRLDDLMRRNLGDLFVQRAEWETIVLRLTSLSVVRGAEAELRRGDGGTVWALQNFAVLGRGEDAVVHLTAVDISDRKRTEAQIEHHAYHDVLTQLPNRRLLRDRLERSILSAKRARRHVAVLFLDLDGFKEVNDTLGHAVGDVLLCEVADRLRGVVRKSDTVARFGGDEFTIMLPDLVHPEDAPQVAQKILEELERPIPLAVPAVELSASIGIAIYPQDGEDPETLLRNADAAMYRAKEARAAARSRRPRPE
ncbi:MAG: diguanylate cyclase domain-containing protein, partial [Thermoanaerobaculia bacterium]